MSGRVLWLVALTTSSDVESGELLGLTIRDAGSWRPLMVDAIFRPASLSDAGSLSVSAAGASWDVLTAGGVTPDVASFRLPFSLYCDRVQELVDSADVLTGPHVQRDVRFLRRYGVRIDAACVAADCGSHGSAALGSEERVLLHC